MIQLAPLLLYTNAQSNTEISTTTDQRWANDLDVAVQLRDPPTLSQSGAVSSLAAFLTFLDEIVMSGAVAMGLQFRRGAVVMGPRGNNEMYGISMVWGKTILP